MLTGAGGRASKRSLIVRFTVSGQAPCSGAERRNKELDEVSTAILGGEAGENDRHHLPAVELATNFAGAEKVDQLQNSEQGCGSACMPLFGNHLLMVFVGGEELNKFVPFPSSFPS